MSNLPSPATATPPASAAAPAQPAARPGNSFWKPALLILSLLGMVAWLGSVLVHGYHYVETDDAYLTGHLHQISPLVEGQVKEVLVRDNQSVQAGDVLVRLNPLEFELAKEKSQAALEQARAQENQARAAAAQSDAFITEATARVRQATAQFAQTAAQSDLAKLNLTRTEQLFASRGVVSQSDLDNTRSAFTAAEAAHAANQANVAAAESSLGSAQAAQKSAYAQIAAASANVAVAASALRDTERRLSYATLVAPVAGRIGNKSVEVGNYSLPGQILLALCEPELWIVANFKETQLPRMRPGQDVEITVDVLPDRVLHGTVESISPASGAQFALLPPDNATGNFNKVVQRVPVKIKLDQAVVNELGDRLRLGLSVVVNVRVR